MLSILDIFPADDIIYEVKLRGGKMEIPVTRDVSHLRSALKIPRFSEIPKDGLYMEQLIEYLSERFSSFADETGLSPITRSMINNYVKARLVVPPVNKKYTSYSIASIIVMYIMKTCYSTKEIGRIIALGVTYEDIPKVYDNFCNAIEKAIDDVFSGNAEIHIENGRKDYYLLDAFAHSFACKIYVQNCF